LKKEVTIFKNILETDAPFHREVTFILDRIKQGKNKELIKSIRAEKDKTKRNELKKRLPSICFSGTFNKRADSSLILHSGLICLDLDGYSKKKELEEDRAKFKKSKFVYAVFVSPSGNGLKVLVQIPQEADNHKKYFNALNKHFASPYFDTTSKNVSRVCYESSDPHLYVNEKSKLWEKLEEDEYQEKHLAQGQPLLKITNESKIVEILLKWWTAKYPMTEGRRNHNVYVIAQAMNEFGIIRSTASIICNNYASKDFPSREIETTIASAYSKTHLFDTKYYENTEIIDNVKQRLKRGEPKNQVKKDLQSTDIPEQTIDAVIKKAEEGKDDEFWTKTEKGVIKIVPLQFKRYLEDNGFHKYSPEGSKSYVFVKITNNLIDHTSEKEIKDFVLDYLYQIEDVSIYNYFAEQTRLFKEEFLTLINTIDVYFIEDTSNTSYLYYKNCAVQVTGKKVITIDYVDLDGYVWKDQVIDRAYKDCITTECDYRQFISNVCNGDYKRILSMESTIGFLMQGHKNLSYCPAVILNDEVISDNPEGGTGKGIFMNALSHMKKLVTIDGKAFAFEKSFAYQLVSADTQILCFDDVKKYFNFERLFSVVTEGLTLEKKNKDAIKIPFDKSPKIAITTNYAIKGAGNSFARRKWELELYQHYNKNYSPQDEFGKLFFGDWDDDEWCVFDNYMIECLQLYLNEGLVESNFVNLKIRQLSAATSHDFIEWCGLINGQEENLKVSEGVKIYRNEMYFDFINEYPDYGPKSKFTISRQKFYKWLHDYCLYKTGKEPTEGRDMTGRWIELQSEDDEESVPF
jgi:SOS response regulatory protein OraA/RecX